MPKFQTPRQMSPLNRSKHVWVKTPTGRWKCVLCGAITREPSDDCEPDCYEDLTDEERAVCPPKIGKK